MTTFSHSFKKLPLITSLILFSTLAAKANPIDENEVIKIVKGAEYQSRGNTPSKQNNAEDAVLNALTSDNEPSKALSKISNNRQSIYRDVSDTYDYTSEFLEPSNTDNIDQKSTHKKNNDNNSTTKTGQKRENNPAVNAQNHDFNIASTSVTMNSDLDGDGYYSEFSVNFDADTIYNSATVYAYLYLSFEGGPWELYYSTDYFTITGNSYFDDYTVKTLLSNGFPPGSYDILIDLYDAYDDSIVATISAYDSYELSNHYLEDTSFEGPSVYSDFSIFNASITLLDDLDNDGFYQSFSLQFDADVTSGSALIYAEIWIKDSTGIWEHDFTTEDFVIDGNSTLDTYILETVLESGYSAGYYDYSIEIFDAQSGELLTTSENLAHELYNVPLEDATSDLKFDHSGITDMEPISTISQGSGGAGSMGLLLLFIPLIYGNRLIKRK